MRVMQALRVLFGRSGDEPIPTQQPPQPQPVAAKVKVQRRRRTLRRHDILRALDPDGQGAWSDYALAAETGFPEAETRATLLSMKRAGLVTSKTVTWREQPIDKWMLTERGRAMRVEALKTPGSKQFSRGRSFVN